MPLHTLIQRLNEGVSRLSSSSCVVCGQHCPRDYGVCHDCELELPRIRTSCQRCGIEKCAAALIEQNCGKCLLNPPAFSLCKAAFPYVSPINRLIANFKFNAQFDSGFALSSILASRIQYYYANQARPQLLIPVPLHRNRLRARGFNQAVEIGRVVSRQCHIPLAESAVIKLRDTTPQVELNSAHSRKTNLRDAFAIADTSSLENLQFVAVLDDVVTTMATVATLSRLLKKYGVQRVDVWCLARAYK